MVNNEREYFEMEKEKEKKGQCLSIKIRSRESRGSVLNYEGSSVSGILYYLR